MCPTDVVIPAGARTPRALYAEARYGLATGCVAGGQGIAMVVESMA